MERIIYFRWAIEYSRSEQILKQTLGVQRILLEQGSPVSSVRFVNARTMVSRKRGWKNN